MVTIDLSDFNRLAREYRQRAQNIERDPFGRYKANIGEAMLDALHTGLSQGTNPQSMLTRDYQATKKGHYGSSPQGDQSVVNPQEWLDPSGVAAIKAKHKMPGPHASLYGSAFVTFIGTPGGSTFNLKTKATMQPYPYDPRYDKKATAAQKAQGPVLNQPAMPIMHYLDEGWVDPQNPDHKMNPRNIRKHVIEAFKPYLKLMSRYLLKAAGFRESI